MAEGKCATCAKYILVIFNLIFWVIGVLLMSFGIWILASDAAVDAVKQYIHLTFYQETLAGIGYGILGVGCCMFFIGFCGCCGAIRESAIMLAVYIFFMAVLILGELAAVIYIFVERSSIEDLARDQLLTDVKRYNSTNEEFPVDFIQLQFRCCGSQGYADYYNYSAFFQDVAKQGIFVPDSCCQSSNKDLTAKPENSTACQIEARDHIQNAKHLYTTGCLHLFNDWISGNSAVPIALAAGIMVVAIIGIVFAVFLCKNRTEYDFYDE